MKWWLSNGGETEGPFPVEQVRDWIRTQQIEPDLVACREDQREWRPLWQHGEFADLLPQAEENLPGRPPRSLSMRHGTAGAGTGNVVDTSHSGQADRTGTRGRFGVLWAAAFLCSAATTFELLDLGNPGDESTPVDLLWFGVIIAGTITWAIFHYHLWSLLPVEVAEVTPAGRSGSCSSRCSTYIGCFSRMSASTAVSIAWLRRRGQVVREQVSAWRSQPVSSS